MKLEEANKMTLQEQIDYAIDKLVEQGEQCFSPGGTCAYGNDLGQHCAVGWLLDHEDEKTMSLGGSVAGLIMFHPSFLPDTMVENQEFFCHFQSFHDSDSVTGRERALWAMKESMPDLNFDNHNWKAWIDMGIK